MDEELAQLKDLVAQLQADPAINWSIRKGKATGLGPVQHVITVMLLLFSHYVSNRKTDFIFQEKGSAQCLGVGLDLAFLSGRRRSRLLYKHFFLRSLEGEAREEVNYRCQEDREDPDKILAILQELYGWMQSYVSLHIGKMCGLHGQ